MKLLIFATMEIAEATTALSPVRKKSREPVSRHVIKCKLQSRRLDGAAPMVRRQFSSKGVSCVRHAPPIEKYPPTSSTYFVKWHRTHIVYNSTNGRKLVRGWGRSVSFTTAWRNGMASLEHYPRVVVACPVVRYKR
jgi:hypothetical protein